MSETIDLKPGVDFFPASKAGYLKRKGSRKSRQSSQSKLQIHRGGSRPMDCAPIINLNALVDNLAPEEGFVRDLLNAAAKELTRGQRVRR